MEIGKKTTKYFWSTVEGINDLSFFGFLLNQKFSKCEVIFYKLNGIHIANRRLNKDGSYSGVEYYSKTK